MVYAYIGRVSNNVSARRTAPRSGLRTTAVVGTDKLGLRASAESLITACVPCGALRAVACVPLPALAALRTGQRGVTSTVEPLHPLVSGHFPLPAKIGAAN